MADLTILTNYHWRNFLYGYELPESVRADFDYIPADEFDSHDFIKYRGSFYDASEFTHCPTGPNLDYWHGIHSDTYFSGVLVRFSDDGEQYQIGRFYS